MRTFELKPEHLKLLQRTYIRWEDYEFGAPAVNCKRPYGNSYVYGDIAEILDIKPDDVDAFGYPAFSKAQESAMYQLHAETKDALQLILITQSFEPGVYVAENRNSWRRVA